MPEPAQIGIEKGAQIGNAIFQHGQPVYADAKGKSLINIGIKIDIAQDLRMDHAAADNFKPVIALANTNFIAQPGAANINFQRRFGKREVAGAKTAS